MTADFDLARDLDGFAGDDLQAFDTNVAGDPPTLDNADHVNRVLRRLRACDRETAAIDDLARAEIARIAAWREDRADGVERQRAWLTRSVEGWMRSHNAATGAKTVSLPNGKVKLRAPRERVLVEDSEVDLVSGVMDPFVKTVSTVLKIAIAKGCKRGPEITPWAISTRAWAALDAETGERLPGVYFEEPAEPTFSLDLAETDQPAEPGVE